MAIFTPHPSLQESLLPGAELARQRLDSLSRRLQELVAKAVHNESVLKKFQQFELELLAVADLETLLARLLEGARQHFGFDCVELLLFDPENTLAEMVPDATERWPGLQFVASEGQLRALYRDTPAVYLLSGDELASLPVFAHTPVASAAMLPLLRQGRLVGSLHFGARDPARFSADKSTDFIAHLASVAAVCLENSVNQERLHRLSMVDVLTRVENRRAFDLSLDKEIARAQRNAQPLSLLFVDLDHFKQINDRYGHPAGDAVLRQVAQFIAGLLRRTDHVCRYGGEEFALILPDCDAALALEVAERIRQQVAALRIPTPGGALAVTLSVGACCWEPADAQPAGLAQNLVAAADQAVYQAKAAGRDCVHYRVFDPAQ